MTLGKSSFFCVLPLPHLSRRTAASSWPLRGINRDASNCSAAPLANPRKHSAVLHLPDTLTTLGSPGLGGKLLGRPEAGGVTGSWVCPPLGCGLEADTQKDTKVGREEAAGAILVEAAGAILVDTVLQFSNKRVPRLSFPGPLQDQLPLPMWLLPPDPFEELAPLPSHPLSI